MKVSEAQKQLDQSVERVVSNWGNGNLSDAIAIIKTMNPFSAAYVCILASERMGGDGAFIRRLQNEGLDSMTKNNW